MTRRFWDGWFWVGILLAFGGFLGLVGMYDRPGGSHRK